MQDMSGEMQAYDIVSARSVSGDESGNDDDAAFTDAVAQALAAMAERSRRRQADVMAALRGAGLPLEATRVAAALQRLVAEGKLTKVLPLSGGIMLVTVAPSLSAGAGYWPVQRGPAGSAAGSRGPQRR